MEDHQQQQHSSFSSSAVDEAYINGLYLGLSFNSMLTNSTTSPPVPYSSLQIPKSEPYNFFSDASSSSSHQQIPNLLSLENIPSTAADQIISPNNQRRKRQRSKLSDKVRSLQKLLPVSKKMDMATVLEETYKYVKYLQAQVSVLQCMPDKYSTMSGVVGDLSRQEVLRVMVNSAVAQDKMYSLEQLKEIAQRNLQANLFNHQMIMFDSNPPPIRSTTESVGLYDFR